MKDDLQNYVYALMDPRDEVIFYIGEGCGHRPEAHEVEAALLKNQNDKVDKICEIKASGNEVRILILARDIPEKKTAFAIEALCLIESREAGEVFGLTTDLANIAAGDHEGRFRPWNCPEILPGFDYRRRSVVSSEMYKDCIPLYEYITANVPEFSNAITISNQHIRTQPRENGFEFVLKPKQGQFIHFEYITRGNSTDYQVQHAEKIRNVLGEDRAFTYAKVERQRLDLDVHQHEQVARELELFIQDVYQAETRIEEGSTK